MKKKLRKNTLNSTILFSDESTNGEGNEWCFKDYILFALVAVVGVIVTVAASRFVLALGGLRAEEEAANPIAILFQCVVDVGTLTATIIFAVLQSIAYVAGGSSTRAGLVVFMAVAGFALWFMYPRQQLMELPLS